ncbi:MAG: response regulator [Janthinobacterium lividum]
MPQTTNVIIIDDSVEDCYLIKKRLKNLDLNVNVISFSNGLEAYNYLTDINLNSSHSSAKNIIILDIYMPLMDGFEFVEEFEKLPTTIQKQYTICALTSSVWKSNMERMVSYKSIKSFLEKPIKTESLLELIES